MKKTNRLLLIFLAFVTCQVSQAQTDDVSIDDFSFLQGYWTGIGFGGQSEEVWMPPVDGRMFGIFKQSQDTELVFTEFMEILSTDEGFVLRLKHFNPDFSGWEEKNDYVTFKLASVANNKAEFGGLSYEITAPNELQIRLRLRDDAGEITTEVFDFVRANL